MSTLAAARIVASSGPMGKAPVFCSTTSILEIILHALIQKGDARAFLGRLLTTAYLPFTPPPPPMGQDGKEAKVAVASVHSVAEVEAWRGQLEATKRALDSTQQQLADARTRLSAVAGILRTPQAQARMDV